MTARIDVRYRKPIPTNHSIKAFAKRRNKRLRIFETIGWVELPDGSVAADAIGTFIPVKKDDLAKMGEGYPTLAKKWMVS